MKKFLKFCLFFLLLVLLGIAVKDHTAKFYINNWLKKEFGPGSRVQEVKLRFGGGDFSGVVIDNSGFRFTAGKISADFELSERYMPKLSKVSVRDSFLKIDDLERVKTVFPGRNYLPARFPAAGKDTTSPGYIEVELENARIDIVKDKIFNLSFLVSLGLSISDSRIKNISFIEIDDFLFKSGQKRLDMGLKRKRGRDYSMDVSVLKFKDTELKDIRIDFILGPDKIVITGLHTDFFGIYGSLEGEIDYTDYSNICADVVFKDVSLEKLKDLFLSKEQVSFGGYFTGSAGICFDNLSVSGVDADLYNKQGGRIDVKERKAVSFLEKRMDSASYNTLMDSLQDYQYNEGRIEVSGVGNTIKLVMVFSSPVYGERNLTVNLYDFIGGKR
jgi:hypothetical protein